MHYTSCVYAGILKETDYMTKNLYPNMIINDEIRSELLKNSVLLSNIDALMFKKFHFFLNFRGMCRHFLQSPDVKKCWFLL